MSLQSLYTDVDQVRSFLIDLQNNFLQLPVDYQSQVSNELDRVAFQLRDWLQGDSDQYAPQEVAPATVASESRGHQGFGVNEPWLGMALKQAHSGAWKWDLITNTVEWSAELYDLFGFELPEGVSNPQNFFDMIHPDERAIEVAELEAAVKRGGPFYVEFHVLCRDGRTIWVSSAGTAEHDQIGRPIQAAGICQDITDRKRTEAALRESEERERAKADELKTLMNAVPAMIWIARDPQCKEMVGNRYGYEFLEMWEGANISKSAPEPDLAQQPYRNFKNGREIPDSELPMQVAASTGVGARDYEFDLVFDNGVTKNLLGNVLPLTDQDGKPAGSVAAFVDITERKRVENELRMREAQLRTWNEHLSFWNKATNSFFWVLAPDGSYRDPILTDPGVSGKPFERTRGMEWMEIIHSEGRERTREHWKRAIELQKAFEMEARVWSETSQQYRWFSHRAVPRTKDGTLAGWVGASIDIQGRKEMEQALMDREAELRESEQRFRIALASAPISIFAMDKDLRYSWIYNPRNKVAEEVLLGRRDDEVMEPEAATKLIEVKRSVIETGQAVQREVELRIDGEQRKFILTLDPILDPGGKVTGLIGAALDTSEQRQLEAVQREIEVQVATQRRLLEAREDERAKIARDLHDGPIQTLVSAIFDIHNLKEDVEDQALEAELEPLGSSLKEAIQELRHVVNELRPPTLVHFGLAKAIQEHADEVREKYPGFNLTLDLPEGSVDISRQVSLTLYRICQEAVQNIIRHSKAAKAVIRLSLENGQVVLEIRDTGIGFSVPDDFSRLIEDKHYGLAGMKERAEAVGGTIKVLAKPDKGTKIKVSIPVEQ